MAIKTRLLAEDKPCQILGPLGGYRVQMLPSRREHASPLHGMLEEVRYRQSASRHKRNLCLLAFGYDEKSGPYRVSLGVIQEGVMQEATIYEILAFYYNFVSIGTYRASITCLWFPGSWSYMFTYKLSPSSFLSLSQASSPKLASQGQQ